MEFKIFQSKSNTFQHSSSDAITHMENKRELITACSIRTKTEYPAAGSQEGSENYDEDD